MQYRKFILLVPALLLFLVASAQDIATIEGYVKDSAGAVAGASVMIKETQTGTTTNDKGYFEIKKALAGTYTIQISYTGYLVETKQIKIQVGKKLKLDFELKKDHHMLSGVDVTGKSVAKELKTGGFSVNVVETKQYANTTADLNQVLNQTTGVRIREQGGMGSSFNFSINGLSGKAVKYFIDGVPVDIMGSAMSLNNIPVNLAERVEVYKGVVPVQLGSDAMGGAVNVITGQRQKNFLDVSYSYGSFNSHRGAFTGQYVHQPTGLIVKASAFYNASDNNYIMKDVEVLQGGTRKGNEITDLTGASFVRTDSRRFHDDYHSLMGQVELGLVNKKWADVIFVGIGGTESKQDLQTGFEQNIVYGNVTRKSHALSGTIRYKKDNLFVNGLQLSLYASRSTEKLVTADTLLRQYYWDGTWTTKAATEMGGIKSLSHIIRPRTFARANLSYTLNDHHSFNLNYTADLLKNESYNELIVDKDETPGKLNKHIAGLAYQQEFFDKKWVNTFFGKYYGLNMSRDKWINNAYRSIDTSFANYGFGVATRYTIWQGLGVKASFEHAYRLQEVEEMFGDGLNVQPNPDLKPESSDNINLGAYYGFTKGKHRIFVEGAGFYRNAKDFIYPVPDQRSKLLKNENKSSVRVTGFEGEVRYDYNNTIGVVLNATYQNAINTTKFGSTASNIYEATYLNKIPNQPWFFGNAALSIGKNDVFKKRSRMQFNWTTQYVHWFYLTWEAFGNANGKSDIPDQLVHNATLTYSLEDGRYNISAECRNLTDNLSFDNFRLQKPGRAFFVKFRYFLK